MYFAFILMIFLIFLKIRYFVAFALLSVILLYLGFQATFYLTYIISEIKIYSLYICYLEDIDTHFFFNL